MRTKLGIFLCVATALIISPSSLLAQEIPASVKKKVVSDFRPKLSEFMPFGTSQTCSFKPKGDANCDDLVNQFDLSVWQIEFNASDNPRRSDFNNDGLVNLLDYGIWKNTFYPAKPTATSSILQKIAGLFNISVVTAQEAQPGTGGLNGSQAVLGASGEALVVNNHQNGTTQQVAFGSDGNPANSQIFGDNGEVLSGISFLNTGTTTVTTEADGIEVQITQTAEGPVLQFFRNPDGSLIASKSWPTADSYQRNDPPMAVTLPGKSPNTFLTLNIQPNGSGILQVINVQGEVLTQSQITRDGIYSSYDFRTNVQVETLNELGITIMSMPNNLGGKTLYNFYKNGLFSITQTDNQGNNWLANRTDSGKWEMENMRSAAPTKKTVDNPIQELNGGTPSPEEVTRFWNYYTSNAANSNPDVDFSTSFNSNSNALRRPVSIANIAYDINQVPPESSVLGVIKEAHAANMSNEDWNSPMSPGEVRSRDNGVNGPETKTASQQVDGTVSITTSYTGSNGQSVTQVQFFGPGAAGNASEQTSVTSIIAPTGTAIPAPPKPIDQMTPAEVSAYMGAVQTACGGCTITHGTGPGAAPDATGRLPGTGLPGNLPAPAQPAPAQPAPAQPAPAQPAPAQPAGGLPEPPPWSPGLPGAVGETVRGEYHGLETTTTRNPDGTWTTESTGHFTQTHNPTGTDLGSDPGEAAGTSSWTIQDGPHAGTTVNTGPDGAISSVTDPQGNTFTPDGAGGAVAQRADGSTGPATDQERSWLSDIEDDHQANNPGVPDVFSDHSCFLAGTRISTPDGPIPIEKLSPGMKVYSYNEKTRRKEISDFEKLDINLVSEYLIINKKIHTTIYHPFYKIVNDSLITVRADQLKEGDVLLSEQGKYLRVDSIELLKEKTTVYNLMNVSPNNNFFAEEVLVHNYEAETPGGGGPAPEEGGGGGGEQQPSFENQSTTDNDPGSHDAESNTPAS